MIGRGAIIAAVLRYLAVVGCVVWPAAPGARLARKTVVESSAEAPAAALPRDPEPARDTPRETSRPLADRPGASGPPFCGVAMQLQRIDLIDEYEKSIDEIAALGADTVSIVVDA